MKHLIEKGTILTNSVRRVNFSTKHQEIVSFLIAHGADVNLKSNGLRTALYYARRNEFEEIVRGINRKC